MIHGFTTSRAELEKAARPLLDEIDRNGSIWISWPKKASKVATDITEDVIRDVVLPIGLVDVFRPSQHTPDIARQAVAAGATALWLQLGIASAEARSIAEDAGLLYVEDRCLIIEQRRLGLDAPVG